MLGRVEHRSADVATLRQRLDHLERRCLGAIESIRRERSTPLRRSLAQLAALDPQATLNRGYAVVHKQDRVVSSVGAVAGGDGLIVKVADGGFPARVEAPVSRRGRRRPLETRLNSERVVQPVLFP